jgi:hypothetical protein
MGKKKKAQNPKQNADNQDNRKNALRTSQK